MKTSPLATAIGLSLFLTACTTASLRPDTTTLQTELSAISPEARLPSGQGDVDLSVPLTLERAVQVAFANNPQVRAALSRLDAIQAERVQAGLVSNPMLSLMALRPEGGGRFQLEYGLMQSLYDMLARSRRITAADAEARRREAEVLGQLVTLAQDTRSAAVQAWLADQALALEQEWLAIENESLLLSQRQVASGAKPMSELIAQRSAAASRAHAASGAESSLTSARAELAGYLGLSSATGLVLSSELATPELANLSTPEWQAWAAQHRLEGRVAAALVEQAHAQRAANSGTLRVTLPSAGVAGMREADGMALQGLALQITLPIFDTGQARQALTDAQVAEAEHQSEAVRRQISLEMETALANVVTTQEAVRHAEYHYRQQQKLELLARRTYHQGASDYASFRLATRNRLLSAQEQLAARQALWTSLLELERAAARETTAVNGPK